MGYYQSGLYATEDRHVFSTANSAILSFMAEIVFVCLDVFMGLTGRKVVGCSEGRSAFWFKILFFCFVFGCK